MKINLQNSKRRNENKKQVVTASVESTDDESVKGVATVSKTSSDQILRHQENVTEKVISTKSLDSDNIDHNQGQQDYVTNLTLYSTALEEQNRTDYRNNISLNDTMGDFSQNVYDTEQLETSAVNFIVPDVDQSFKVGTSKSNSNNTQSSQDSLENCLAAFADLSLNTPQPCRLRKSFVDNGVMQNSANRTAKGSVTLPDEKGDFSAGDFTNKADRSTTSKIDVECKENQSFTALNTKHPNVDSGDTLAFSDPNDKFPKSEMEHLGNASLDRNVISVAPVSTNAVSSSLPFSNDAIQSSVLSQQQEANNEVAPLELPDVQKMCNSNHKEPVLPCNESVVSNLSVNSNIAALNCANDALPDFRSDCKSKPAFCDSSVNNISLPFDKQDGQSSRQSRQSKPDNVALPGSTEESSIMPNNVNVPSTGSCIGVSNDICTSTVSEFAASKAYSVEILAKDNSSMTGEILNQVPTVDDRESSSVPVGQKFHLTSTDGVDSNFTDVTNTESQQSDNSNSTIKYNIAAVDVNALNVENVEFQKEAQLDILNQGEAMSIDDVAMPEPKLTAGNYTMDFDKFDDPNFDPFRSTQAMLNSPTKTAPFDIDKQTNSYPEVLKTDKLKSDMPEYVISNENSNIEDVNLKGTPCFDESTPEGIIDVNVDPSAASKDPFFEDASMKENLSSTFAIKETNESSKQDLAEESPTLQKPEKLIESAHNNHEQVEVLYNDNSGACVPQKDTCTMDFSNSGDPNFDPFKSNKSLLNDESERSPSKTGSYSVDFDSPSFDLFKSNKAVINSPTKEANFDIGLNDSLPEKSEEENNERSHSVATKKKHQPEINDKKQLKNSKPKLPKTQQPNEEPLSDSVDKNLQEQDSQDPDDLPKGAHTMDYSKFDDPNFNPFESNNALLNDDRAEVSNPGAYTMSFDKFDDPHFDPFESNKGIVNSPTKDVDFKTVVPKEPLQQMNDCSDLLQVSTKGSWDASATITTEQINLHSKDDSAVTTVAKTEKVESIDLNFKAKQDDQNSQKHDAEVEAEPKKQQSNVTRKVKSKKKSLNRSVVEHTSNPEDIDSEPPPPKGSYTIDFSKFDDPNFDPFKSNKALVNEDEGGQENDSYLDPFKSANRVLNSPVKESSFSVCDEPENSKSVNLSGKTVETKDNSNTSEASAASEQAHKGFQHDKPKEKTESKSKLKKKQVPHDVDNENDTDAPPKGSYTIDFSQFDDPNNDPFKSNKALVNDFDDSQEASIPGGYTLDFDDTSVDPFTSTKGILNSPVKETSSVSVELEISEPVKEDEKVDGTKEFLSVPEVTVATDQAVDISQNKKSDVTTDVKSKPKKKKKKPIKNDGDIDQFEDAPPKGSYSFDFSQFDDPNFDPFKSNKALVNDVDTLQETSVPAGYTVDLNDSTLDPFKSTKGVLNSPVKKTSSSSIDPESSELVKEDDQLNGTKANLNVPEATAAADQADNVPKNRKSDVTKDMKSKPKMKKKKKPVKNDVDVDQCEDAPPKGSYSFDFSQFDDPNFDPFKSNKALVNDNDTIQETSIPAGYTVDLNDSTLDPVKSTKGVLNSPAKETSSSSIDPESSELVKEDDQLNGTKVPEATAAADQAVNIPKNRKSDVTKDKKSKPKMRKKKKPVKNDVDVDQCEDAPPKGSYSFDFSQFDDPNFDPFKSNKALVNDVDTLQETSAPGVDTMYSNLDPFKSTKGVSNSPVKEVSSTSTDPESSELAKADSRRDESQESPNVLAAATATDETGDNSQNKKPDVKTNLKSKSKKKPMKNEDDVDQFDDAPPKGSYAIDFSQFDDPNFDPFKSNKALVNDVGGNLDTFKSTKEVLNSPVKQTNSSEFSKSENSVKVDSNIDVKMDQMDPVSKAEITEEQTSNSSVNGKANPKLKPKKKKNKPVKIEDDDGQAEDVPPKGSYSIDYSKFDDPNFDPFKSNKSLTNDTSKNIQSKAGSYSLELDKLDEPNFDPFKSKKSIVNSPDKDQSGFSTQVANSPTSISQSTEANIPNMPSDINDNEASCNSVEKELSNSTENKENKTTSGKPAKLKQKSKLASSKLKKKRKPTVDANHTVTQETEIPKGAYSMDFSKYDDPNFNPFQSKTSSMNDEIDVEDPKPKAGGYTMDFDKFDDPNFDPFKSSKSMTNDVIIQKLPVEQTESESHEATSDIANNKVIFENANEASSNVDLEIVNMDATVVDTNIDLHGSDEVETNSKSLNETFSSQSYSIDPSNYDDPNFNPFQSSKGLANSPTKKQPLDEEKKFQMSTNSTPMSFDAEDEDNSSVFTTDSVPTLTYAQSLQETVEDPLVQTTIALENAMCGDADSEAKFARPTSNAAANEDRSSTVTSQHPDMTSDPPHYHPAASQLARNMSNEKWNLPDSGKVQTSFNLISFSPRNGDKLQSSTTVDQIEMHEGADRVRYEVMKLLQKKEELLKKKSMLSECIVEEQVSASACKATLEEVEKMVELANSELDGSRSQVDRILEDIASAKRVYQDYHSKANELLPILKAHKQGHQELRTMLNKKLSNLQEKSKELQEVKQEAHMSETRLANELAQIRSNSEREVGALQAKLKIEQMAIASLTSSLQDKTRENNELTKICDELIAGAES